MKVIIAGSRGVTDYRIIATAVESSQFVITEVVSGTALGVDRLGEDWATLHGVKLSRFPAHWDLFGKSAGYVRNQEMADYANALIAIWDGKSRGTAHMIYCAQRRELPIYVHRVDPDDSQMALPVCGECGGTGEIVNDGPYSKCDDCNGTGKNPVSKSTGRP